MRARRRKKEGRGQGPLARTRPRAARALCPRSLGRVRRHLLDLVHDERQRGRVRAHLGAALLGRVERARVVEQHLREARLQRIRRALGVGEGHRGGLLHGADGSAPARAEVVERLPALCGVHGRAGRQRALGRAHEVQEPPQLVRELSIHVRRLRGGHALLVVREQRPRAHTPHPRRTAARLHLWLLGSQGVRRGAQRCRQLAEHLVVVRERARRLHARGRAACMRQPVDESVPDDAQAAAARVERRVRVARAQSRHGRQERGVPPHHEVRMLGHHRALPPAPSLRERGRSVRRLRERARLHVESGGELWVDRHGRLVEIRVQAGYAPARHHQLLLVRQSDHQQQAHGVVQQREHVGEALLDRGQRRNEKPAEDGRVAEKVVAEEVLRGRRIHEQLVCGPVGLLVQHPLPGRLGDVWDHRLALDVAQHGRAVPQRESARRAPVPPHELRRRRSAERAADLLQKPRRRAAATTARRVSPRLAFGLTQQLALGHAIAAQVCERGHVRLEVPRQHAADGSHVEAHHLVVHLGPVLAQESAEVLELEQHALLQDLYVRLRPAQLRELGQEKLAHARDGAPAQPFELGRHVRHCRRAAEPFGRARRATAAAHEVELARERVQSIDVNLVDLSVQDGIDELRRQRDLLNELAQLGLRRAPVAKLHRERYALLLQRTDLARDRAERGLEATECVLHTREHAVAPLDLRQQPHQVVALGRVRLDRAQLCAGERGLQLAHLGARIAAGGTPALEHARDHLVRGIQFELLGEPLEAHLLRGDVLAERRVRGHGQRRAWPDRPSHRMGEEVGERVEALANTLRVESWCPRARQAGGREKRRR
mmetsp:Transcript_2322/g.9278  ORF Transcript_2322/g.9278 Transcript_2322/m.9278 type:complete len:831 (-) Transcript_2322:71-2563(-)